MKESRSRATTLLWLSGVVALGLGSRYFGVYLPTFVAQYAGDALWALALFLAIRLLAPSQPIGRRASWAWLVAAAVEFSQLYHAPWIDQLRHTTLGGLVLGFGFLWSDLLCYTIGIVAGAAAELALGSSARGG